MSYKNRQRETNWKTGYVIRVWADGSPGLNVDGGGDGKW